MNNYDEIKMLVEASRRALSKQLNENQSTDIRKQYGLLTEQPVEDPEARVDVMKDIEDRIKDDTGYETAENPEDDEKEFDDVKSDKKKAYRISGGIMVIHSKDTSDLQLTTDDKVAFQESMDEFKQDVTEMSDLNKLNLL
jgi:hypothetical protein